MTHEREQRLDYRPFPLDGEGEGGLPFHTTNGKQPGGSE